MPMGADSPSEGELPPKVTDSEGGRRSQLAHSPFEASRPPADEVDQIKIVATTSFLPFGLIKVYEPQR